MSSVGGSSPARTDGPFPRLLPPAEDFRLILSEDPDPNLPPGPSCGGEAGQTLLCRAFTLTLENVGNRTVHISLIKCFEPDIVFEIARPSSSSGWWPVSQPGKPSCTSREWLNIRLKPGESTEYSTRLISPRREIDWLGEGSYKLRAHWALWGCTEVAEGTDCLAPLQVFRGPTTVPDVGFQDPVMVRSSEVTAISPPMPNLGALHFAFEVTRARPSQILPGDGSDQTPCAGSAELDCALFHYVIRNLADRPVRNATLTCSDDSIRFEYRLDGEPWKPLPAKSMVGCTRNILVETPIPARGSIEGTFNLKTRLFLFDTSPLHAPGDYQFRFTFQPSSCFASPDGRFCLARPALQPSATAPDLTLRFPESQN